MVTKILLVDDEENVLQGYQRNLRKQFEVDVAIGGKQALQAMERRGPYAVVVADMRMPGMSGLDLLAEARALYPDTVRIMLTGNSDQKTAVDAVNQGQVFRFLSKPCPAEDLEMAIRAGLRQYELMAAEKELLEQTLTGAITVLSDLLACVDPVLFRRSQLVRERAASLGRRLGCAEIWEVEVAALLAPIGRIALPAPTIQAAAGPTGMDALLATVPEVGARLLQPIPRLQGVARIVRYQAKGYDGSGAPAEAIQGDAIPLGARILKVLWDFSELEDSRQSRRVAMEELRLRSKVYDPKVLDALGELLATYRPPPSAQDLPLRDLRPGMVLAFGIHTADGASVLPSGLRLGPGHLELLSGLARLMDVVEPVAVLFSEEDLP